jgi:hypothetical protein
VRHGETRQKGWLDVFVSCSLPGDKGHEGRTDANTGHSKCRRPGDLFCA